MSMSAVEPGTRLSDRFLLEDRVHQAGGATLWKATDEVLARPVAVHTFSPDFELIDEVVTAARAASRLTDPRLTQVFDAADDGDTAYVVTEWVTSDSPAVPLSRSARPGWSPRRPRRWRTRTRPGSPTCCSRRSAWCGPGAAR
jgi:hypothetical protein